jgi:hypothetical protein
LADTIAKDEPKRIFGAMKTMVSIDAAERIVLSNKVREVLGVYGPMRLAMDVCEHSAKLTVPVPDTEVGSKKSGRQRSVYKGSLPEGWDSGEAILQMRESRIRW